MKKIVIFSLMHLAISFTRAQSLDDVGKMMENKKFGDAKTVIDKYIADPKNAKTTDALYYKGRVYNSLSREATTSKADAYNYKLIAYDAFKKYATAADKTDIRLLGEGYASYLDIYLGLYDLGAQQFNAKEYKDAYNSFTKAQEVESFIMEKNYTYNEVKFGKLDTALVMNTAAAALQMGDTIVGLPYYRKIADANVGGKDYENIYQFLASYYKSKNDKANMQAMLEKGKMLYPQSSYWNELEMQSLSESGDKSAMFAKYDELYKKEPNNFTNTYNYAVELYNSLYGKDAKAIDITNADKLTQVLKTAISIDTTNDANMLMNNHLYNYAADYSAKAALIKGGKLAKPAELQSKKDLNAKANAKMDELIPYAENTIKYYAAKKEMKTRAKINYQLAAGYLADIYRVKADVKKAAEYEKLKDSIKL